MSEPPQFQMRGLSSQRLFQREDQILGVLINIGRALNTLSRRIDENSRRIHESNERYRGIMATLADLLQGVQGMSTELNSMDQLLDNLIEQLKQNQNDPAEVQRVLDLVEGNRQTIRDQVAQHTPSGEPPPTPSNA